MSYEMTIAEPVLMALMWAFISLAICFTVARTVIRYLNSRRLYVEDGFVFLALVFLITMGALYVVAIPPLFQLERVASGKEKPGPTFVADSKVFLQCQFAIIVLFWSCLWCVKFSFLFFYRRLFEGIRKYMVWWWAVFVFTLVAYLGCWVTQLLACDPLSDYFIIGQCNSDRDVYYDKLSLKYATAVDISSDVFIMALPLRLLWSLQVNTKQKSALAVIFSVGVIVIAFSIVRVVIVNPETGNVDPVWLALWSMLDSSIAVIVSCLPTFRVLFTANIKSHYKYNNSGDPSSRMRSPGTTRGSRSMQLHSQSRKSPMRMQSGESVKPNPMITGGKNRTRTASSTETILPKEGIKVRNDFVRSLYSLCA
ncbi:MAG: hypothetical protein M1827_005796 [Pycnora praestabilis]|nr:MAG: hypothetical protein M1827_005796 [Pycnora praestabilis]